MNYVETIRSLFAILADCNASDCVEQRQPWQRADDASQRCGAYGHIRAAIIALAGETIVEDWAECGEVDITLANRLSMAVDRTEPAGEYPPQTSAEDVARLTLRVTRSLDRREAWLVAGIDEAEAETWAASQRAAEAAAEIQDAAAEQIGMLAERVAQHGREVDAGVARQESLRSRLREIQGLRESILTAPRHFPSA